ncbi:MAG: SDR family NAD(P)-dependent oxidoreductase [bacterium]|nr:SDR family NAD(P)-dependent oxidoreductase [bacterium]
MKTMLITGGAGFIGTNAAAYFAKKGYQVIAVDNLSRNGSVYNRDWLLSECPNGERIVFEHVDVVTDAERLGALVSEADVIIHAAGQVAVTTSVEQPLYDFEINVRGTLNVLEAARRSSRKPFVIFTSTNKVYGGLERLVFLEKETRYEIPSLPRGISEECQLDFFSPYGCSKGAADQYVRDYSRIYDLPTVVFRQSCIYGERQFGIVDQGWVSYLAALALTDRPITVFGDGKQVRDLLNISDLCRAFELAIAKKEIVRGKIYNMGGGAKRALSVGEFLKFLENKLARPLNIHFADWRPGDQKVFIADTTRAKEDFGWEPLISFEDGFTILHEWLVANHDLLEKSFKNVAESRRAVASA